MSSSGAPVVLTLVSLGMIGTLNYIEPCNYQDGKREGDLVGANVVHKIQEPSRDKGAVISEGYKLRNRLYDFVDKDNNRILDKYEKRGLLDLLGFHDVFLDESNPISVRPTKDGDGRLNIYFSEGFDGYVGTISYSRAEEVVNSKKEEPKKKSKW